MSCPFPPELIALICDFIPMSDLPNVMLVNTVSRYFAERLLYSSIYLDFFDYGRRHRSVKCLQALATYVSAASSVRHLYAHGLGLVDSSVYATFMEVLSMASNISTLDLIFNVFPDSPFFPESLTQSTTFLPNLSALNVDDPNVVLQLVPGRPLHAVRIQETIHEDVYGRVINALSQSVVAIKYLQLKLVALGEDGIIPSFLPIAHSFHSLICLGIQFVLPSPSLRWDPLLNRLCYMASMLSSIPSLRVVSLVTLPDPPLPLSQIDVLTRRAAEMIIRNHLPQLHRIEIRWHGWLTPKGTGDWAPVGQDKLLRTRWHLEGPAQSKGFMHPSARILASS